MLPTVDEALYELKLAEELNPGPWVRHSVNTGIAAMNIAEKVSWLDPEKAYIVGLLHDIGRFEQVRIYNTFRDAESVNHAQFSADLLFRDGMIRD